jgi:3-deoxy-D-manno-octulosonate 8-phosphate phosphatase (KDO 8-P phosphatase)
MTSYKEKLKDITTLIFDIDGVMTNGDVLIFSNEIVRTLNSRDAYAIQYAVKQGLNIFVISGGNSPTVKDRLLHLGAKEVILSSFNKLKTYTELKGKYGISDHETLYMGDDIPDYEIMQTVGLATCPQDAAVEIKAIAHYQSPFNGGRHCVRDIIEQTLRVQGKWMQENAFHW